MWSLPDYFMKHSNSFYDARITFIPQPDKENRKLEAGLTLNLTGKMLN